MARPKIPSFIIDRAAEIEFHDHSDSNLGGFKRGVHSILPSVEAMYLYSIRIRDRLLIDQGYLKLVFRDWS